MSKYLFAIFCFCYAITTANPHEQGYTQNDFETGSDLKIIFDDFPSNSIPDLSSVYLDKKLDDFLSNDDIDEAFEQQSEFASSL